MENHNNVADVTAAQTPETTSTSTEGKTQEINTTATGIQNASTTQAPASGTLPAGYLLTGYYKGEGAGRYIDPALVDGTAKEIAEQLAAGGLKQSAFNSIVRELKRANKKTLPLEAKQGALSRAIVKAKLLEQRKRAPHLLLEILDRSQKAVHEVADYDGAYQHLEAIGAYLCDYQE